MRLLTTLFLTAATLCLVTPAAIAAVRPVRGAELAPATSGQPADLDDDAGAEGDEHGACGAQLAGFVEPSGNVARGDAGPVLDPGHLIPPALLSAALDYYHQNLARIGNKDVLTVVDFSASSKAARLFMLDMKDGRVTALHVAHGSGSDPRATGFATVFSNTASSNCSSLGFYLTAETYSGKHGYSLRLDGLSATNSNVRERAVVIHGADYVHDADVKAGRSWGCLAVSMAERTAVIDRLKGGSLIFAGLSKTP